MSWAILADFPIRLALFHDRTIEMRYLRSAPYINQPIHTAKCLMKGLLTRNMTRPRISFNQSINSAPWDIQELD